MIRQIHSACLFGLSLILLSSCAHRVISKNLREEAQGGPSFSQVLQDPQKFVGSTVIWGGTVIETVNVAGGTEIFVLETPLSDDEEPKDSDGSQGRFIAETGRFLDPMVYKEGRKITVAGKIDGGRTIALGQGQYTYPVVRFEQSVLWTKAKTAYPPGYWRYWYSPWYRPWYGPWYGPPWYGPYWSPWYGPWWGHGPFFSPGVWPTPY